MKKNLYAKDTDSYCLKFDLKMKLSALFMFIALCLAKANTTYSQKTTVSLNYDNVTLERLIDVIESKTDYYFIFKTKDIDLTKEYEVKTKDEKVTSILEKLFKGSHFTFKEYKNQIYLLAKEQAASLEAELDQRKTQEKLIIGKVVDQNDIPIVGASIIEKGTTNGVSSDFDGNYTLSISSKASIIVFSFVGFKTVEVPVGEQTKINITLREEASRLTEVVVVGYGTQQKRDITGSVSVVSGEDIESRSVTNVSNALQGAAAGVSVTRNSSAPGSGNTIRVRGITTLQGNTSPLILVDNVPVESINDVNPEQVESISVLKDGASASIYGSRAAAGVILITTKRAKEGVYRFSYSGEHIINTPTQVSNPVNVIRYMQMENEKTWNDNGNGANEYPIWGEDVINDYLAQNAINPDQFPNTDWKDLLIKKSATGYRHNVLLSGGSEKVRTNASLGYEHQNALYDHFSWKRYNFRINNDLIISDKFGGNIDVAFKLIKQKSSIVNPISGALNYAPVYPALWSDGRLAGGKAGENVYAEFHNGGFSNNDNYQFYGKIGLYFKPIDDLKLSVNLAPNFDFYNAKTFRKSIPYWDFDDPNQQEDPNYITGYNPINRALAEVRNKTNTLTSQVLINYRKEFDLHSLDVDAGYEEFYSKTNNLGVRGEEYASNEYPFLNQAPLDKVFNSGTSYSELAYRSYFGRVSYNFNRKYYLQATLRGDGSSRFAKDYRWGTFPSISGGWVVSEEGFFESIKPTVNFLKFRASYGSLGNDRLGNYLYRSVLQFTNDVLLPNGSNVEAVRSAAQRFLAIEDITWETTSSVNLAVDMSLFDNRWFLSAEYFKKKTTDMLLDLSIPNLSGYEDPRDNVGSMNTEGWEFNTRWKDQIGDLRYSFNFNIFDSKSIIGDVREKRLFNGNRLSEEGIEFNSWYGYQSDGIFQTQDEVDNSPVTNSSVGPGDIKYKDISGPDGLPDGEINELDQVVLAGSLPRLQFGGGFNLGYRNFDMGVAFQGVGKRKYYQDSGDIMPFIAAWRAPNAEYASSYWSLYNTSEANENAKYPRLSENSVGNNYRFSDYWLRDGSYLRIKNITLGYTLNNDVFKDTAISSIRLYLAANDFFTFDKLPKGIDPEQGGGYLITKSLIFGVKANF
ncbi:SusC/RagA family TonB-linked outer membrane protein [Zhouia amylolytica]|uniref:SusC/RagA family TonB-linked outer membrane protein n=1 Tax=Zhouia amylolytica TaxID=376730 RepID=UPI0020CB7775|nr:TonB-dependent receptor [Zhouia amylolytica]MCQ0110067.1 TonB-dependent receptor [Zhouia amylolytica]